MDLPSPQGRLNALRQSVDEALAMALPDGAGPRRVQEAMRYAVMSPGKRIRPLLALVTAQNLGCPVNVAMPAACALEFVHAASLVLDDLPCMDDAATRRGQPSVHAHFGEDVAVLTGVALLNHAYAMVGCAQDIAEGSRCQMMRVLAETVGPSGLVGGQDRDLVVDGQLSIDDTRQLHHEKTGVLFVAAVEIGALAAGADEETRRALRSFAMELGLAFQAMDDISDPEDLLRPRPSPNLLGVLGQAGARDEARSRLAAAKAALAQGPRGLNSMGEYVDFLVGRVAA